MRNWLAIPLMIAVCSSRILAADEPKSVTFAEQIAPLVFEQCAVCHRPGEAAPFALLTYQDVRKHAGTMERVIEDRYMPPWQPEAGHGDFRGERRLTEAQIALFAKWVKEGMPEGDPKKTPPIPKFPEGWQLGKPDLIVKMERVFNVPADGPDIYQNFVLPLNLTEDKWVTAVEFRASAPSVVHHALYYLDSSGRARGLDSKEGQPGFPGMGFQPTGRLGGWAVGARPLRLPEGLAYPLKKGSDFVMQTHFHPSGKAEKEVLTVGIYFADRPPSRTLVSMQLPPVFGLFSNINLAPGQAELKVSDAFTLPVDVDLVAAGAHAHYLGKTMKADATLPDKSEKKLFSIRDWDFNWQGQYLYKDFVRLPKGTKIRGEVTWDNSASNPRNPSQPPIRVHWGEGSTDEMGSVSFLMVAANEAETKTLNEAIRNHVRQIVVQSRLRGDEIDWKKLGVEPPDFWKSTPAIPKKKEAKEPPLTFRDLNGREQTPLVVEGSKAHVLFFLTTDCPISNGSIAEIEALQKEFASQCRFFAIQVDPDLTPEAARTHAREYGLDLPIILDGKHQLVTAAGATRTPEVAVLLPDGTLAYRGRIDDRYPALGKKRLVPSNRDLHDALSAIVAGQSIKVARTEAIGCSIPQLPAK